MKLADFLSDGGFTPEFGTALAPYWNESPELEAMPEFLTADFFRHYYPLLRLEDELTCEVENIEAAARKHPALRVYANKLYRQAYHGDPGPAMRDLPLPAARLGERGAGIFTLLLALGALPKIRKAHEELGLPESYMQDIAKWIAGTVGIFKAAHNGTPGTNLRQHHWLRHSMEKKLFRIGRFEFLIHYAPEWLPAICRNRTSGETVALCRNEWRVDAEGWRAGSDGLATPLEWEGHFLTGTPIDAATGRATPGKRLTLDLDVYEAVLTPHEWVPSVHIPGGGGMTPELAGESLKAAVEFFRTVFKKEIKAFVCESWILNPAWQELLPESNLAGFMRELYLFPLAPEPRSGLFFIFGRDEDADWSHYPADNSMRRAFHKVRESGRPLRAGGMFILTEDLKNWGRSCYR